VVSGWADTWFCLSLPAFLGTLFSFQAEAAFQPFESSGRGKTGKRNKARSEEIPVWWRLRSVSGLGKNGVRIEKLTVLIRAGLSSSGNICWY